MTVFRAYVIDATTGQEMSDHPINGKTWLGTGGNHFENGEFVRGTADMVRVADYADLSRIYGEKVVTKADFDRPVVIKVWGPESQDWRYLVSRETTLSALDLKRAQRCVERSF